MNHSSNPQTSTWSATALAKMALVTALYVVVTVLLAPLSFGPIQLRLAELFNYLGVFNKRYLVHYVRGCDCQHRFASWYHRYSHR